MPEFEGRRGDVLFKAPHHDPKADRHLPKVTVGLATAAAPTFFRPLEKGGYPLADGGVWTDNPVMLAVIEALSCSMVGPTQIDVLTIGCGNDPNVVSSKQIRLGGVFFWRDALFVAMRLRSLAATIQARLLLGPPDVTRLDAPANGTTFALDDWRRGVVELVPAAAGSVKEVGDGIARRFLVRPVEPFQPRPEQGRRPSRSRQRDAQQPSRMI